MKKSSFLILAAGTGSRLMPHTSNKPKCMVEIDGRPLLLRQLSILDEFPHEQKIIVGGYKGEMIMDYGTLYFDNPDYKNSNMVWSLKKAMSSFENVLIVSYGDIVFSRDIFGTLLESDEDISVVVDLDWQDYWQARHENYLSDAESLKITEGFITDIGRKNVSLGDIEAQYIGLMKFQNKGIDILKQYLSNDNSLINGKHIRDAYMTDLFQQMISDGFKIKPVLINGNWIEIDNETDLQLNENIIRARNIEEQS